MTEKIKQTSKKAPKLGIGLLYEDENEIVIAPLAGRLEQRSNTYFVKQNIKRYLPHVEDRVIGIVEDRVASDGTGKDVYHVNIRGPFPAEGIGEIMGVVGGRRT